MAGGGMVEMVGERRELTEMTRQQQGQSRDEKLIEQVEYVEQAEMTERELATQASALARRIGALCELALLAPSPEMRGKVIEELARLEGERQERLETE